MKIMIFFLLSGLFLLTAMFYAYESDQKQRDIKMLQDINEVYRHVDILAALVEAESRNDKNMYQILRNDQDRMDAIDFRLDVLTQAKENDKNKT